MTDIQGKTALVAGGSRGLGRGAVEALVKAGAEVVALARDEETLAALAREVAGVRTFVGDVADPATAERALREIRPDIVVLSAGATPHMAPAQEQSWEQFSRVWNTDVRATLEFGKQALGLPLAPGSTVIVVSSGAAIGGSPLSGGYSGAKRMQWFLAGFLQQEAAGRDLGIRFLALLPKQIVGETALGHAAATGYAERQGITKEAFLERFGTQLTPAMFGQGVVDLLTDATYAEGLAFGITGGGLESLD